MASQTDPATKKQSRIPLTQESTAAPSRIILTHSMRSVRTESDRWMQPERRERVAVAAYYIAERRRFEPGHEQEDWLAAEAQLSALETNLNLT
jgi:hypothetical protein